MKFSTALVSLALGLAGVEGSMLAAAAPAAASSTNAAATTKRGVPYTNVDFVSGFGSNISWVYDWADTPGGTVPGGREFIPMLWGADSGHTSVWVNNANAAIASGSTHLLGFNEPDLSSESNLSPQAAASAWLQWMQPFADRAKLCSPPISNGDAPMGTAWLDDFVAACSGCTIDCIAITVYSSATDIDYFESYISSIGTKYGLPIWITEIIASGTTAQQQQLLETLLPYLDGLSSVERYAYFMAGNDILVDDDGNLTPLGQTYNSV